MYLEIYLTISVGKIKSTIMLELLSDIYIIILHLKLFSFFFHVIVDKCNIPNRLPFISKSF